MSQHQPPGRVENFTSAFLVSFGVLVFFALLAISAVLGFIWAVVTGYLCDKGLSRLTIKRE